MLKFCFKCPSCESSLETKVKDPAPVCPDCGIVMRRDYHTEGVGIGTGVKVSRTGTMRDQARLFLPDQNEFKSSDDPDGKRGARKWLEEHQPKEKGGYNPLLEIERRSF